MEITVLNNDKKIKLITQDQQEREPTLKVANKCQFIKDILESSDNTEEDIPLTEVNAIALDLVLKYCEQHQDDKPGYPKEIEKPLKSAKIEEIVDKWDADFIKGISLEQQIELMQAASYLNNASLLDLTCCQIATNFKGKKAEQLREEFNIECDLTEQDLKDIEEENKWTDEDY